MKLKYKDGLKPSALELNRGEELANQDSLLLLNHLVDKYGFVIPGRVSNDLIATDWKAIGGILATQVVVNAGIGVFQDDDGLARIAILKDNQTINIPTTAGVYRLIAKYSENSYEEGTISMTNGSDQVVGIGTKFTEIFGTNRRIIIGNHFYVVLIVIDDNHLTLTTAYTSAAIDDLSFQVGGWFPGGYPLTVPDNVIYLYNAITLTIQTLGASVPSNAYEIAQITVAGGVVTKINDTRTLNLFDLKKLSNIVGEYGVCTFTKYTHTQASTEITVIGGGTYKFPDGWSQDMGNKYYIRTTSGWAAPFFYAGKTADKFLGVTFPVGSSFTSAAFLQVFDINSAQIDELGLKVADQIIRYMATLDSSGASFLAREAIVLPNNLMAKDFIGVGEGSAQEGNPLQGFYIERNIAEKYIRLLASGWQRGSEVAPSDLDLIIDLQGVTPGSAYGNIIIKSNFQEVLRILPSGGIQYQNGIKDLSGAGSPDGVVGAPRGSTYRRSDGGIGTTFYVKEAGIGNTGWVAK